MGFHPPRRPAPSPEILGALRDNLDDARRRLDTDTGPHRIERAG
jgi:hypothetical protein